VGAWDLDHARIHVSEDAQATAQVAPRGERIRVTRGRVDVDVAPGASGRIEVVAGAYTFVDVGTRFSVDKQPATTFLTVTEGVVDVRWNHRRVATLSGPQGFWRSPSPRQVTPARPRLIRTATAAAVPPSCSSLLTGNDAAMAIRCLDQRSMGDGVGAEAALYEMGRLRRDRLGDLSGALQAFEEGRRRFPDGALSVEVQLSIVDLLPRLGRYQESLDESASLVAQASTVERTAELRLLRGNVYREGLNDCGRALIEYRALAGAKGRVGDDGLFFEAVCLEQMARRSDAVSAYQRYLARADARRRDQAERRLQALLP
jgi:hypothetical protein